MEGCHEQAQQQQQPHGGATATSGSGTREGLAPAVGTAESRSGGSGSANVAKTASAAHSLSATCSMPVLRHHSTSGVSLDPIPHPRRGSKAASSASLSEEALHQHRNGSKKAAGTETALASKGSSASAASIRASLGLSFRLAGAGSSAGAGGAGSGACDSGGATGSGDELWGGTTSSFSSSQRLHSSVPADHRRRGNKPLLSAEEQLCFRRVPVLAAAAAAAAVASHDHGSSMTSTRSSSCGAVETKNNLSSTGGSTRTAPNQARHWLGRHAATVTQGHAEGLAPLTAQPSLQSNRRAASSEGNLAFGSSTMGMVAAHSSSHLRPLPEDPQDAENDSTLGGTAGRGMPPKSANSTAQKLPLEDDTENVLDRIFPKSTALVRGLSEPRTLRPLQNEIGGHHAARECASPPQQKAHMAVKAAPTGAAGTDLDGGQSTMSTSPSPSVYGGAPSSASSSGVPRRQKAFIPSIKLMQIRKQMIVSYQTVTYAFESFYALDVTDMSLRRFIRFIGRYFSSLSREVCEQLFEHLDTNKDGIVSMSEFHMAVEAVAPVKTIEGLRRRWIALGYASMRRALQAMQPADRDFAVGQRLGLQEFSQALTRSGVTTSEEHQLIFSAVHDPSESSNTVTMEHLAAALSAVSPFRLLEDIRDRVTRRYENLEAAWDAAAAAEDAKRGGPGGQTAATRRIWEEDFCKFAVDALKLSEYEGRKAFRLMTCDDGEAGLSRRAFVGACRLSDPSLMLEDVRRKVRQRFQSIAEVFSDQSRSIFDRKEEMLSPPGLAAEAARRRASSPAGSTGVSLANGHPGSKAGSDVDTADDCTSAPDERWEVLGTSRDFQRALSAVALTDGEAKLLFQLVDSNGDGKLSPAEFVRGLRLFAPSCVLEDLRLRLMRLYGGVSPAFARRYADRKGQDVLAEADVKQLLEELNVGSGVHHRRVFDCVESRPEGGIVVAELASALRAAGPGDQVPLKAQQRDARARQQVRTQLARFRLSAQELKTSLRQVSTTTDDEDAESESKPSRSTDFSATAPAALHPKAKRSMERLSQLVTGNARRDLADKVQGYLTNASDSMASDDRVLSNGQSRYGAYCAANRHRPYLEGEVPELVM